MLLLFWYFPYVVLSAGYEMMLIPCRVPVKRSVDRTRRDV
jgi:hypothetical protein